MYFLLIYCKGFVNFIFHYRKYIYTEARNMNNSVEDFERVETILWIGRR